jgi:acetylornithine deacetylase/succinyl-diaminopimelate desuccinylase-like protein
VTLFLADVIERPSLSRDEHAVVQRIGEEMQAVGFDEVIVDGFRSRHGSSTASCTAGAPRTTRPRSRRWCTGRGS